MIKLTATYSNTKDLEFAKKYYTTKHGQLLSLLLADAVKASDMNVGLSGASPEQRAPYVAFANLTLESLALFQQSFGAYAKKILSDLPNFTKVRPVVQISEV